MTTQGWLYVLQEMGNDPDIYKIGRTDNLARRLSIHNSHHYHDPKLLYKTPLFLGYEIAENFVHWTLKEHRLGRKEYFHCPLSQLRRVVKSIVRDVKHMTPEQLEQLQHSRYFRKKYHHTHYRRPKSAKITKVIDYLKRKKPLGSRRHK